MSLSLPPEQLEALHNLADKQAGRDVDWISISDARALTELGFAQRTRSGWEITPSGAALIQASPRRAADEEPADSVSTLRWPK